MLHDVMGDAANEIEGNTRGARILVAGGGTGGHAYPALAIAGAIHDLAPESVIEFAGTTDHIEWRVVPEAGYTIHPITVSPLHRKLTVRNLAFPFKLVKGLIQSLSLVRRFDPDVVVGTGGYVAGPVLWAAASRGIPIVLQEQNAFAGKTNKLLGPKATQVHIAFEDARKWFPGVDCRMSGNPVRKELTEPARAEGLKEFGVDADKKVVLVFGGSLGSAALNRVMLAKYLELLEDPGLFVIWQTGSGYYDRYSEQVAKHERLRLLKYIDRMDLAYAAADLVVCRSGASTCSELALTGTPAILVPSPNVAEDHQTYNARSLADDGAAVLLPEPEMDDAIVQTVRSLLADVEARERMSAEMKRLARPNAAETIARDILELAAAQDGESGGAS